MNLVIQLCKAQLKKRDWNIKKGALERLGECNDPDGLKVLDAFIEDADDRDLVAVAESAREKLFQALERLKKANEDLQQKKSNQSGDGPDEKKDSKDGANVDHVQHMDSKYDTDTMALIDNLEKEQSKYVRATLVKELGRKKDPTLVKVIAEFLNDKDSRVVANTIEALGMIKSPIILSYILPFVNHTNPRIKANVNKILFKFDSKLVLENLRDMIVSTKERNRSSALFALIQNPSDETYDILKMGYDDPSPALRTKIRMALRKMRIQKFVYSLQDPKKLSTVLGSFIGGVFLLYFIITGAVSFWDGLDHRGNRNSNDSGTYSGTTRSRGKKRRSFTMGRRVINNPRSHAIEEGINSFQEKVASRQGLRTGRLANSPVYEIYDDPQMMKLHDYWDKGDLHNAEEQITDILDTNENERVLFYCFQMLIKIYKKTGRKDKIAELMAQIDKKCPKMSKLAGTGTMGAQYNGLVKGIDTLNENLNGSFLNNSKVQSIINKHGLSSEEQDAVLNLTSQMMNNIKTLGAE